MRRRECNQLTSTCAVAVKFAREAEAEDAPVLPRKASLRRVHFRSAVGRTERLTSSAAVFRRLHRSSPSRQVPTDSGRSERPSRRFPPSARERVILAPSFTPSPPPQAVSAPILPGSPGWDYPPSSSPICRLHVSASPPEKVPKKALAATAMTAAAHVVVCSRFSARGGSDECDAATGSCGGSDYGCGGGNGG